MIIRGIRDFLSNNRHFLKSDHINNATDGQGSKDAQVICRRMHAGSGRNLPPLIDSDMKKFNVYSLATLVCLHPYLTLAYTFKKTVSAFYDTKHPELTLYFFLNVYRIEH